MKWKFIDHTNLEIVKPLLKEHPYNHFRNYRVFTKEKLSQYTYSCLKHAVCHQGATGLAYFEGTSLLGACFLIEAPFETRCLGVGSARIDFMLTCTDAPTQLKKRVKRLLVGRLLELSRKKHINFISSRVAVEDSSYCHALEANGFQLMDNILNYFLSLKNWDETYIQKIRGISGISLFEGKDREPFVHLITKNPLQTRFLNDSLIPHEKALAIYKAWINDFQITEGESEIIVYKKKETICGFLTFELNKILYAETKIKCFGHGLSWVDPKARGAYVVLLGAAIERRCALKGDFADINVHSWNYPVIRVVQHYKARLSSANYTFHKWIHC